MRLLITGTRNGVWAFGAMMLDALGRLGIDWSDVVEVVQGACPVGGVDEQAEGWAELRSIQSKPMPCDRSRETFPQRNQRMVNYCASKPEPWACIAMPSAESRGTLDCYRRAKAAGAIGIVVHEPPRPENPYQGGGTAEEEG